MTGDCCVFKFLQLSAEEAIERQTDLQTNTKSINKTGKTNKRTKTKQKHREGFYGRVPNHETLHSLFLIK